MIQSRFMLPPAVLQAAAEAGAGADDVAPDEAPRDRAAEQYRAISEVTADWSYALRIEPDGHTLADWMSPEIRRVSGFSAGELGRSDTWLRLLHPDDRPVMRAHLSALQAGRTDTVEYRIVTRSGETRWLRDSARPLENDAGGTVRIVGGVRDVTPRRQAEVDRSRLVAELQSLGERMDEVVASLSGELRGPAEELRSAAAALEDAMAAGGATDALQGQAARIRAVADLLVRLAGRMNGPDADGDAEPSGP